MRPSRLLACLLCCGALALGGCRTLSPASAPPPGLFQDQLFAQPAAPIDTAGIFALSDAMRRYLQQEISSAKGADTRRALFHALYQRDQLKLEYDAAVTRNAAQTFEARAGNCLSLAIMTAALARELNFSVQFQLVDTGQNWSRAGKLYFSSNHVNIVLDRKRTDIFGGSLLHNNNPPLVVDFIPITPEASLRAQPLTEQTVVAMYLNNRAAELLAGGQVNDAYWAARQAIAADPGFLNAYNTLGVIYQHHGELAAAERALRHALSQAPESTIYLSNLAQTLDNARRPEEAALLRERLRLLEPYPPFYFFQQGQEAMAKGDYGRARKLFERELERMPDYHELHYWMAVASFQLQDLRTAERHLQAAMEHSTSREASDLYAAKRNRLRATSGAAGAVRH